VRHRPGGDGRAAPALPYPLTVAASVGRALVAEAGTITATVTGLAWRAGERWLHLDVGAGPEAPRSTRTVSRCRWPCRIRKRGERCVPGDRAGRRPGGRPRRRLAVGRPRGGRRGAAARGGAYTVSAAVPVSGHPVPTTVCTLRGADRAPADAWADWADWTEWSRRASHAAAWPAWPPPWPARRSPPTPPPAAGVAAPRPPTPAPPAGAPVAPTARQRHHRFRDQPRPARTIRHRA